MRELFGITKDGTAVEKLTLQSGSLSCVILTYGASLQSLLVPDKNGALRDVVLGYDSLREYEENDGCFGAVVGRYANRIAGGRFTLNGTAYRLVCNNGKNHLHGGTVGFSRRVWTVAALTADRATLCLNSFDGEEGYPGQLSVSVTYTLRENALRLHYQAVSSRDTICNLTNHSYFNLGGHASGSVLNHRLRLFAQRYTPTGADSIPTGELAAVAGTPMDFRQPAPVGAQIEAAFEQLRMAGGYDHNYELEGGACALRPAARVFCAESGIEMLTKTTLPGLQFYTANHLSQRQGKNGATYAPRCGLCLETQCFPDSPNQPNFPAATLSAGTQLAHTTVYSFQQQEEEIT